MENAMPGKSMSSVRSKLTALGAIGAVVTSLFAFMDHTAKVFEGSKVIASFAAWNCSGDPSFICPYLPSWLQKLDSSAPGIIAPLPAERRSVAGQSYTNESADIYPEPNDLGVEKLATLGAGIPIEILEEKPKFNWIKIRASQQGIIGYVRSVKITK